MPEQPGVLRPPDIFYEQQSVAGSKTNQTINAQQNITYLTERIEASPRGILLYQRGSNGVPLKYPCKGWPTPEAMWSCNVVKRIFIGAVLALATEASALPVLGFLLTPWPWKIKLIDRILGQFNHTCDWILTGSYYKEEIYSPCARELKKLIYLFLYNLGISAEEAKAFSKIFSTLIETDNAYRYRIQDIFSETTKGQLLKNPRTEINRLIKLFLEREGGELDFAGRGVTVKFYLPAKILTYALLIPKIRRAFLKTTQEIDISSLALDSEDRYHVLNRDGYNFLGRSYEDRYEEWVAIHDGNPPEPIVYKLNP